MKNKLELLKDISESFDLDRIRNLPVPEKFKLVEYTKLIHREAILASKGSIVDLEASVNYSSDRTYCLFAMLVVNGVSYELLKEIILNYAQNFDRSDIYFGKIVVLGIGVLMISENFAPDAIVNFILQVLGDDFLLNNYHYVGYMEHDEIDKLELDTVITYRSFDSRFRKVKYDLLAFIRLSETKGVDFVKETINKYYDNRELSFYFNMLNISCNETRDYLYKNLKADSKTYRMDHLLISGVYGMLTQKKVFDAHYLFNSIIGKYSRYDKDSSEIEDELNVRLNEILALREH